MAHIATRRRRVRAMDFAGQRLAERASVIGVGIGAAFAFGLGYAAGDYDAMLRVFFGSVIVTACVTVPPYAALYARSPVKWRKPRSERPVGGRRSKRR